MEGTPLRPGPVPGSKHRRPVIGPRNVKNAFKQNRGTLCVEDTFIYLEELLACLSFPAPNCHHAKFGP